MTNMPTSKQLRRARQRLSLTQDQVAIMTGVSQTAISQIENGKRVAKSYSRKLDLCKLYGDYGIAFQDDGSIAIEVHVRVLLTDPSDDIAISAIQSKILQYPCRAKCVTSSVKHVV